jgi:hypothetical protein
MLSSLNGVEGNGYTHKELQGWLRLRSASSSEQALMDKFECPKEVGAIKLETQKAVPPAARGEQLFGFQLFPRPLTYNVIGQHKPSTSHTMNPIVRRLLVESKSLSAAGYGHR